MSKGLEALDKLMKSFYELCEECNCNEDMYQMHNLTSPHHIVRKELERLEKLEKKNKKLKEENEKLKLNLHLMSVERLELLEEIKYWEDKYFNRDGENYEN